MEFLRKNIKDGGHYDVLIAGAGPGGTCAAIILARKGLNVLLVESSNSLGGCWTSGMMGITLDMKDKGGLPKEISDTLVSWQKASWVDDSSYTYDIEAMKYLLDALVCEAKVNVIFMSNVTDVFVKDKKIVSVLIDGPESYIVNADYIIDGTGIGQVAFLSGCSYEIGYGPKEKTQPASLQALVTGVPHNLWQSDIHNYKVKKKFQNLLKQVGVPPSYPNPLLFSLVAGEETYAFQINHEYGVRCDSSFALSSAIIHARKEINESIKALKMLGGWSGINLVATASSLIQRDTRRIQGLYRLTVEDGLSGKIFSDGVVPCSFCIDVHALDNEMAETSEVFPVDAKIKPYEIPIRAMISSDVLNLFMVGRCISGDFLINSSYRVMGNAASTGEAVALAIVSLPNKAMNYEVDGEKTREMMINSGYKLADI